MIYTHYSSNDKKLAGFLTKRLSAAWCVILMGVLAISGCNPEQPGGPGKVQDTAKAIHKETGEASWYGSGFHGKETANGDTFDQGKMTAAHPTLPLGTHAKVTNLENGKKVEVTINDRGPYAENRVIDLSSAAANKLDMKADGTAQVKIETKRVKKSAVKPAGKTKPAGGKRGGKPSGKIKSAGKKSSGNLSAKTKPAGRKN